MRLVIKISFKIQFHYHGTSEEKTCRQSAYTRGEKERGRKNLKKQERDYTATGKKKILPEGVPKPSAYSFHFRLNS